MSLSTPVRAALRLAVLVLASGPIAVSPREAGAGDVARDFMERHCFECHDDVAKKGGLDLTALGSNATDTATFAAWVKVHDRLRDGEMPPKTAERPPEPETVAILRSLDARLHDADSARQQREGRARARRLNRDEYQNTFRDLLGVEGDYRPFLPEDGSAQGFDKVGSALGISPEHLEAYLAAAEAALDEVIVTGPQPRADQEEDSAAAQDPVPEQGISRALGPLFRRRTRRPGPLHHVVRQRRRHSRQHPGPVSLPGTSPSLGKQRADPGADLRGEPRLQRQRRRALAGRLLRLSPRRGRGGIRCPPAARPCDPRLPVHERRAPAGPE